MSETHTHKTIAIIGAGTVGGTLGRGLARAGHTIRYGVRDPDAPAPELAHERAQITSVSDAAQGAEVVILSTPWAAAEAALRAAGSLQGKILIDATNPIGPGFALTHGHTDSGAEQVARWAPEARVVKAFNTTGAENMGNPRFGEARAAMFVCGDDEEAVVTASRLVEDLGFEAFNAGALQQARLLEPAAMLWIRLAMIQGYGRGIALGMLRR